MKKFRVIGIRVVIFGLIAVSIYYYLLVEREIKIYEEYEVFSARETWGIAWVIMKSEAQRQVLMSEFKVNIPNVDFDDYYLLLADGRKIKKITYRLISKYKWPYNVPMGMEVVGEKHYPHTVFIYKINRVSLRQAFD